MFRLVKSKSLKFAKNFVRDFSSSLYITGNKAHNTFVVLVPHIDFHEQLKDEGSLVKNIQARKLPIDLYEVKRQWHFYQMIKYRKDILEEVKSEISRQFRKAAEGNKVPSDQEKLSHLVKLIKSDLKNIKEYSYEIEENAALAVLSLPNILHCKTPLDSEKVVYEHLLKPSHQSDSHLNIGIANKSIEYTNSVFYLLRSDAALFEFAVSNYFQSTLIDSAYVQFSNADIVRSVIVEGCGIDYKDHKIILTLADPHVDGLPEVNRLHIVGGATLSAFMAYFARHSVQPSFLPLKIFSYGRKYHPVDVKAEPSLFNVNQESVVKLFIATEDSQDVMNQQLDEVTDLACKLYQSLGYHFRLVYLKASDLDMPESLRLSIQMYSNHLQDYVEVGHVSIYDNFISKRLLFTYSVRKARKFPKIIAGDLLNVQKVLGCILENDAKIILMSDWLKKHL